MLNMTIKVTGVEDLSDVVEGMEVMRRLGDCNDLSVLHGSHPEYGEIITVGSPEGSSFIIHMMPA